MKRLYYSTKIVTKTEVIVDRDDTQPNLVQGARYHRHEVKRTDNKGDIYDIKWYSKKFIEIKSEELKDKLEFQYQALIAQENKKHKNNLLVKVFSWLSKNDYLTDLPMTILQQFTEDEKDTARRGAEVSRLER